MKLSDDDPRYNRFSFPTKFVSYLAAGLPIIALAHRESSIAKMARAYRVGICSEATTKEELSAILGEALAIESPRRGYIDELSRCAQTEFDAVKMRRILYECFNQCAAATRNRQTLAHSPFDDPSD